MSMCDFKREQIVLMVATCNKFTKLVKARTNATFLRTTQITSFRERPNIYFYIMLNFQARFT